MRSTADVVRWTKRKDSPGWYEDENGCHIWTGSRGSNGYPQCGVDGKLRPVHRVRYEREVGLIPEGMVLDHYVCDNGAGGLLQSASLPAGHSAGECTSWRHHRRAPCIQDALLPGSSSGRRQPHSSAERTRVSRVQERQQEALQATETSCPKGHTNPGDLNERERESGGGPE